MSINDLLWIRFLIFFKKSEYFSTNKSYALVRSEPTIKLSAVCLLNKIYKSLKIISYDSLYLEEEIQVESQL